MYPWHEYETHEISSDYLFSVILFIISKASQETSAMGFELSGYHVLCPLISGMLLAVAHYRI